MTDISPDVDEILRAINHLSAHEQERVRRYLESQQHPQKPRSKEEVEAWMAKLDAAIAELREGLTDEELAEIITAMNAE